MSDPTTSDVHTFQVDAPDAGVRLDRFLADRLPDRSRTSLARQVKEGRVVINGRTTARRPSHKLEAGDEVTMRLEPRRDPVAEPEDIALHLLYEDEWLAVVDKSAGMVVHPGAAAHSGTLANALAFHFERLSQVQGPARPGIVHRLDKDTSGVIVVAKDDVTHERLARQFRERTVDKEYLAVVWGTPDLDGDRIDAPLGPHRRHPTRRDVRLDIGKPSQTDWRVEERLERATLVRCFPKTGRTHQIRVHLASIGHPILGDHVYGGLPRRETKSAWYQACSRHALHAHRLRFTHPWTDEPVAFEASHPEDMRALLDVLRD